MSPGHTSEFLVNGNHIIYATERIATRNSHVFERSLFTPLASEDDGSFPFMWMRKERTTTEAQMQARTRIFGTIEAIAIAATVCSCAVGPDFHPIAAPGVNGYTSKPLPAHSASADVIGGDSQTLQAGGDIPGQWWNLFHFRAT